MRYEKPSKLCCDGFSIFVPLARASPKAFVQSLYPIQSGNQYALWIVRDGHAVSITHVLLFINTDSGEYTERVEKA